MSGDISSRQAEGGAGHHGLPTLVSLCSRWFDLRTTVLTSLLFLCVGLLAPLAQAQTPGERWRVTVESRSDIDTEDPLWAAMYAALLEEVTATLVREDLDVRPAGSTGVELEVLLDLALQPQETPAGLIEWRLEASARIEDAQTRRLEGGQTFFVLERVPPDCVEGCLITALRTAVRQQVARDLAAALASQLESHHFHYTLELAGLTLGEVEALQRAIRSSSGYRDLSLQQERIRDRREWLHTRRDIRYLFESRFGAARLEHLIHQTLRGVPRTVRADGRTFRIERQRMPYIGRYVGGVIALILALYLAYALTNYQRHQRALTGFRERRQMQSGRDYLAALRAPLMPQPAGWHHARLEFDDGVAVAAQHVRQAELLLADHRVLTAGDDFPEALGRQQAALGEELDRALAADSDCSEARQLRQALPDIGRSYELIHGAQPRVRTNPAEVIAELDAAYALNPRLQTVVTTLADQARNQLRQVEVGRRTEAIEQALASGQTYRALTLADATLAMLREVGGLDEPCRNIDALRDEALATLPRVSSARLISPGGALEVVSGANIRIGRQSSTVPVEIMLGYRNISRGDRQCTLSAGSGVISVADLGGRNGTMLGMSSLGTGQSATVGGEGAVLALGGRKDPPERGICRLRLQPTGHFGLQIDIDPTTFRFIDTTGLLDRWPMLEVDLERRWLVLFPHAEVTLTLDEQQRAGALLGSTTPCAVLQERDGLWLGPLADGPEIRIGGETLTAAVPLTPGVEITIGATLFRVASEDHG